MTDHSRVPLLFGVDTGGTFTDFFVVTEDGRTRTHKRLSTPDDPGRAVIQGLDYLLEKITSPTMRIVHGSTVATNAVLERRGARTAFITTEGFGDMLLIGRQNRRSLYDLAPLPPSPIVDADHTFEVRERIGVRGDVIQPLQTEMVHRIIDKLTKLQIESVALLFLHSYLNPEHERKVAESLRDHGFFVSASHEVLPEHREYERASTTVLNAYVSPLMQRYLGSLGKAVHKRGFKSFRVMQSSGGVTDAIHAGNFGVHTILSGPAGGVVGAQQAAMATGISQLITFDMGGTSTDVALLPGRLETTSETDIGGYPIRVPMLDIHTVGAGGGSVASLDQGGALRVGPQSAGASPGPACYGQGGPHFTVTDANFLLGRLPQEWFMAGTMRLDRSWAITVAQRLANQMNASLDQLCYGVLQVVNANMERAIKVITIERGYDPRDFTLVSYGGAGSLHAVELAKSLKIPRVLIPSYPGLLSAVGMAMANVVKTDVHTILAPLDLPTLEKAQAAASVLRQKARQALEREGVPPNDHVYSITLDLRYVHQSFELSLPADGLVNEEPASLIDDIRMSFHQLHEISYGHSQVNEPIELVTVRLRAEGRVPTPSLPAISETSMNFEPIATQDVFFETGWEPTAIYARGSLKPNSVLRGPSLVVEDHATTLIPPGSSCTVHSSGALIVDVG